MANKKEEFTLDNLLWLIFIAPIIYWLSYIMNSEKFSLSTWNVDNFSNYIKFDNKFLLVYLIAWIIWLINAIYKKANNFIFMITIYILIVTIGYFFIPNWFHFKDTLILKAPWLIIFSFVFSLIIWWKYTNFIDKNKYKKWDNFKITQKEDEIFCKTENGVEFVVCDEKTFNSIIHCRFKFDYIWFNFKLFSFKEKPCFRSWYKI